jgi:hypothetical protein
MTPPQLLQGTAFASGVFEPSWRSRRFVGAARKTRSPSQISISALLKLAETPTSALAMFSAVIAGLATGSALVCLLGRLHLNWRKPVDPCTQIIREHKRSATALHRAELARPDRLIERRPAGASHGACLGDGKGQWSSIHFCLAIGSRDGPGDRARTRADDCEQNGCRRVYIPSRKNR